jgi:hypothetical protein
VVYGFNGASASEGFRVTNLSAASDTDVWAAAPSAPAPWNAFHWDGTTWRGVTAIPAG